MSDTKPDTADITVTGPVNGMDEPDRLGSYIHICIETRNSQTLHRISIGAAETLAAELAGVLGRE